MSVRRVFFLQMPRILCCSTTILYDPCPIINLLLRKVLPEVTRKGCCCLPLPTFISLSPCLICSPSIWNIDRQTHTKKNAHILLCWLWSLSPVPVQPALEGVEVRCNLVLSPLLVTLCQWFELSWTNVVLVNWTNVVVVVLVELPCISVSVCLWSSSEMLLSSQPSTNLTFWLFD